MCTLAQYFLVHEAIVPEGTCFPLCSMQIPVSTSFAEKVCVHSARGTETGQTPNMPSRGQVGSITGVKVGWPAEVVHTYNLSTWEAEVEDEAEGYTFKASLGYVVKPCL